MTFYGQIRPGNYDALVKHYGHEPPWPSDRSPHVSLVEAVVYGTSVKDTAYYQYLLDTHKDAQETLDRQVNVVRELLYAQSLYVDVEHESILDGNHRMAVSIVTKKLCELIQCKPYQTLRFPDKLVEGRRFLRTLNYDFVGKRVLDLGCAQGMASITALHCGAASVISVDADLRSTTWQLRNDWGYKEMMNIVVANICDFPRVEVDVVLALSVFKHIGNKDFSRLTRGIPCILETHGDAEFPRTDHRWTKIGEVSYSIKEPNRKREVYLGTP